MPCLINQFMSENDALIADSAGESLDDDKNIYDPIIAAFQGLGKVLNYVGIAGFIVLAAVVFLFFATNQSEKAEFFDTWFLYKNGSAPFAITVTILVIFLISQQIHYTRVIRVTEERIKELAGKKKSKYAESLKVKLATSIKKRKK